MTFKPNFNFHPNKKRARSVDAAYDENGIPIYSVKRTAGTIKADAILGHSIVGDKVKKIVRTSPMPTPPRRFNGPLRGQP